MRKEGRVFLKKKEYVSPVFYAMHIKLQDVICTSVEGLNSQVNSGDDWGEDEEEIIGG